MAEHSAEKDAGPRLWERLLPVLNDAVGNGQLTRDEAFAVLDSLGKPRPIPPAASRQYVEDSCQTCNNRHPLDGCADVGCNHNCEAEATRPIPPEETKP